MHSEIIVRDIGEDAALDPLAFAERGHIDGRLIELFLLGLRQWHQFLPLRPVRELCLKLRALHVLQELLHTASEEVDIGLLQRQFLDILRQRIIHRAAHVDDTAHHADARTLAQHGVELLAVHAANDGAAAAHELEGEGARILENPKLRLLIERIVLHQRARTRAAAAADKDLATRGTVARRIARIARDGDDAAGVQPADIGRGRALDENLRIRHAHRAHALTRVGHVEVQRLTVCIP